MDHLLGESPPPADRAGPPPGRAAPSLPALLVASLASLLPIGLFLAVLALRTSPWAAPLLGVVLIVGVVGTLARLTAPYRSWLQSQSHAGCDIPAEARASRDA